MAANPSNLSRIPAAAPGALEVSGGIIEQLIERAQRRPRDLAQFIERLEASITRDDRVAGECLYGLPRQDKVIEGPSVRLAEMMVPLYGNAMADVQALPVGPDDREVTSQATFVDLENLVVIRLATKRRITNSQGHRYSEDMIVMTGNANNAIAFRNCVFKAIPQALWYHVYEAAREKALGAGGTIPQKRQQMVDWFGKLGISPDQVFKRVGVKGLPDLGIDQLVALKGLANAIRAGEIEAQDAFSDGHPVEPSGVASKIKGKGKTDAQMARAAAQKQKASQQPQEGAQEAREPGQAPEAGQAPVAQPEQQAAAGARESEADRIAREFDEAEKAREAQEAAAASSQAPPRPEPQKPAGNGKQIGEPEAEKLRAYARQFEVTVPDLEQRAYSDYGVGSLSEISDTQRRELRLWIQSAWADRQKGTEGEE